MLSFLYVHSDHSILECYNLFSGVELSMRSFFVIIIIVAPMLLIFLLVLFAKRNQSCKSYGVLSTTFDIDEDRDKILEETFIYSYAWNNSKH